MCISEEKIRYLLLPDSRCLRAQATARYRPDKEKKADVSLVGLQKGMGRSCLQRAVHWGYGQGGSLRGICKAEMAPGRSS